MGKSVKKNYVYNLIYQVLVLIIPLISMPYLSRILGADGIGTISYAESIVSYFVLVATLGTSIHGQREVSYVRDSKEERSRVFWETQIFRTITTGVVIIIYFLFALLAVDENKTWLYLLFSVQLLSVPVEIVWFFQGLEEFGKIVFRNIAVKLISLVLFFVLIKTKDDLIYYVLIYVAVNFVCGISLWGYLPKYVQKVPIKSLKPFRNFKVMLALFIPTIATQIYTVLDKTMLGFIAQDPFQNGYYEQATKICKVALMAITALGVVMIPRIGYHYEKGEYDTVREWMYRGYRFVWFLGVPMCLGMIMIAPNFVPWFFGDGYDGVVPLLCILSFLILAIGINTVTGNQYLIPTKQEKIYTITVIIGAVVNFVCNIVLIYFLKSIGAAIASILAETVIAIVQLVIVRKEISIWKILKSGAKYWIAGLIMIVPLYFENVYFSPSILSTCIMIITGGLVYTIVLVSLKDSFFINNVRTIFNKFFKKKEQR